MKRKSKGDTPTDISGPVDIKIDLTPGQLAALAAVALAYNILEDQLDSLLRVATRVPDWIFDEVSSRIHGLDGTVAIIEQAVQKSGLSAKAKNALHGTISTFSDFKKNRDTIIHARLINLSIGIGRGAKQRGKSLFEILLSEDALNCFYDHILALQKELIAGGVLLNTALSLKQIAQDDPNKSRLEAEIRVHTAQFRESRSHRRALTPLPKFPDESELREAANRRREAAILMRMGYPRRPTAGFWARDNSQFWEYQHLRNNALLDTYFPPAHVPDSPPPAMPFGHLLPGSEPEKKPEKDRE
jgi:hypothetical protein